MTNSLSRFGTLILIRRAGSLLRRTLSIMNLPLEPTKDSSTVQSKLFLIRIATPLALLAPLEQNNVTPHSLFQEISFPRVECVSCRKNIWFSFPKGLFTWKEGASANRATRLEGLKQPAFTCNSPNRDCEWAAWAIF